ncbi:MAG: hypothetical protein ACOC2A_00815 [Halanaeroarchaeum sp.]
MTGQRRRQDGGDLSCYVAYCPACERAVQTMEATCPDCGAYVEWQ